LSILWTATPNWSAQGLLEIGGLLLYLFYYLFYFFRLLKLNWVGAGPHLLRPIGGVPPGPFVKMKKLELEKSLTYENVFESIAGGRFKKNVPLKNYTSFRVGGRAKYFLEAKTIEELIKAILAARKFGLPFFILGKGTNLLVPDKGFNGLVLVFGDDSFKVMSNRIFAKAGISLAKLVKISEQESLGGLEWAAGIPGTLGGAIVGNAGAQSGSIADLIEEVEVLEIGSFVRIAKYTNKDCLFGYRTSVFKRAILGGNEKEKMVVLSASLRFKKEKRKKIRQKINKFLKYRLAAQPLKAYSAGSVFKNFYGRIRDKNLVRKFEELGSFNKKGIIPAGFLIEKSGLKGRQIGRAKISEKHANFIVNLGRAKAGDILRLIRLAKRKVKNNFGVSLKEEIIILK